MSEMDAAHRRVLVVVAHPDDAEFGCGASMAKWASEGREVTLILCTNGDKGTSDRSISSPQLAAMRAVAAENAANEMRRAPATMYVRVCQRCAPSSSSASACGRTA